MNKYTKQHLEKHEILEYSAEVSNWLFLIPATMALFFIFAGTAEPKTAGIMYFIALCYILYPYIIKTSTELAITNERIIGRVGFLHAKFLNLRFNQIESVKLSQSLFGKLLDYGDITIYSSNSTRYRFKFLSNPIALKAFISEKNIIKNFNSNI
ncbi:PH domain-containing protein [Allofrancisella frigidaquae]|uniref:PH domain-containing protein n=1 Tax=Allofrancisella frigidaquae TaxID=1085644 RepID=A0A6M3HSU8_9GAMM|nr:PH domain-containing protein [Allofrancisella frigidaquae]QIV94160.1 PH domain-containing protein [Allofrancisella frigidaquae]